MHSVIRFGLAGCLLITCSLVHAQDLKRSIAKRHFATGTQYYNTGNYEAALVEFQKANKLFPVPKMLFNIGRCHEALGQFDLALKRFEEYLARAPNSPNAGLVRERIRNIKRRIKKRTGPEAAPVAGPESGTQPPVSHDDHGQQGSAAAGEPGESSPGESSPAEPVVQPTPPDEKRSRTWPIVGWTAVGVGGAALIASAVLGGLASSKSDDYQAAYSDHKPYADSKDLLDSAEQMQLGSFVALGVGAAAATAGALILIFTRGPDESSQQAASWRIRPGAGGLAVDF